MSDRLRSVAWLRCTGIGCAVVLATPALGAQATTNRRPADVTAAYAARVETLGVRLRDAQAAVARAEEARRTRVHAVPLSYGALRLVADSALVPLASRAAATAWPTISATFGADAQILETRPLTVFRQTARRGADSVHVAKLVWTSDGRSYATSVALDDSSEAERQLSGAIAAAVGGPFFDALDDAARTWVRVPIPAGPESPDNRTVTYIDLATASTPGSRRCLAGDLDGCREYLGLTIPHDPVADGVTPTIRRRLVTGRRSLRTAGAKSLYDACVLGGADDPCLRLARALPRDVVLVAISPVDARRSFMRWTLEAGGDSAYRRLRARPGDSLESRLAAAGGRPADSLLAGWRTAILAARSDESLLTFDLVTMTLLWLTAATALALRSTRWR